MPVASQILDLVIMPLISNVLENKPLVQAKQSSEKTPSNRIKNFNTSLICSCPVRAHDPDY
jgi:hypothetical protein